MSASQPKKRGRKPGPKNYAHPDKWTVVYTPPYEEPSVERFAGQAEAAEYVYRRGSTGNRACLSVLPPQRK